MCNESVLGTATGPVKLRAKFVPENIDLNWYDRDTKLTVSNTSNTCEYDTGINLPTTPTRTGYTFNGWQAIPGTRIQYIESTGTQWIDTGVYVNPSKDFRIVGSAINPDVSTRKIIIGNYNGSGIQYNLEFGSGGTNNGRLRNWMLFGYTTERFSDTTLPANTLIKYDTAYSANDHKITNILKYNDVETSYNFSTTSQPPSSDSDRQLRFFLDYRSNTTAIANPVYIGETKIYKDGELVRDFVPIKDTSGVACMYDLVSKQFFYNAGTGDFIAGPDL